jgi:hypothetical protein
MEDREMNGSKTGSNEAKSSKLILAADHKNDAIKPQGVEVWGKRT